MCRTSNLPRIHTEFFNSCKYEFTKYQLRYILAAGSVGIPSSLPLATRPTIRVIRGAGARAGRVAFLCLGW